MHQEEPHDKLWFKLTPEEQQQIRRMEEQELLMKAGGPVTPTELPICLRNLGLSISTFDKRGDQDFSKNKNAPSEIHIRGGFEYFKPMRGYAYGLNIGAKISFFKEWAVGFHGVRSQASFAGIMREGLKAGPGQGYAAQVDYTQEKKIPRGVYFSPNIEVCMGYVNHANPLILQCLINPTAIATASNKEIWIVERTQDIIPYRIIHHPMQTRNM